VQKTLKGVLVSLFRIIIFGTIGREIRFFNLNMGLHHQSLFRHFKWHRHDTDIVCRVSSKMSL